MIFILVLLFIVIAGIALFSSKAKLVRNIVFIVLGFILIIIAGFREEESVRDYSEYVVMFQNESENIVEPSFAIIKFFVHTLFGNNPIYLFIIFAILGVSLKLTAIKQLTELWFLSLIIYCSNFFILNEMIQIRTGVASAFLLLCVKPIYNRDWKRFLLFSILGFSFHYSAIVIFPLWFLGIKSRKSFLLLSLPVAYLIYFSGIKLITNIPIPVVQSKFALYQKLIELGDEQSNLINVFNGVLLTKIAIFYFLLSKYDIILTYNKYVPILIKIYSISLMSYLVLAVFPPIATRISELLAIVDIVLIPFVYYSFKPYLLSKSIVIFIGMCFLLINLFYVKLVAF